MPTKMRNNGYFILALLVTLQDTCFGDLIKYLSVENGDCDNYRIEQINDVERMYISYQGGRIPNYCRFGFIARGVTSDARNDDTYQICVDPDHVMIGDCDLKIQYFFGTNSFTPKMTFTCGQVPQKYCETSEYNKNLDVEFTGINNVSSLNASVSLIVTAVKKTDFSHNIAPIVAGVIGGLLLIGVIVVIVCIWKSNSKPSNSPPAYKEHAQPYLNAGYDSSGDKPSATDPNFVVTPSLYPPLP